MVLLLPIEVLQRCDAACADSPGRRIVHDLPVNRRQHRDVLDLIGRRQARSGDVRADRLDVHRIERLARRHEQPVPPRPAETDIRAHFGKTDHPDAIAVGREHLDAGTRAGPDVAICVASDPVGRRRRASARDSADECEVLIKLSLNKFAAPLTERGDEKITSTDHGADRTD